MAETFLELKKEALAQGLVNSIVKRQTEALNLPSGELYKKVETVFDSMLEAIHDGIYSSTLSLSGLSGGDTRVLKNGSDFKLLSPYSKKVCLYALATIEENARMGRIAACPTAGSSGIVPAVLVACYEDFQKTKQELIEALILAGEVGRIISIKVSPAGAVAGCQAECGTASSMAAAGLCFLLGGDIDKIFNAVALSLKNILGLTCDPVAGLVEVPCVKRNVFLANHAVVAAELALNGVETKIPVDDVIDAMRETGVLMNPKLKESSEAGLATTNAGLSIRNGLYKIWHG